MSDSMTHSERAELRRIVKGRFELLNSQLRQRKAEIEKVIRERITAEHDEAIKRAEHDARLLEQRRAKLERDIRALTSSMEDAGVRPSYYPRHKDEWVSVHVSLDRWEPSRLRERVDDEFASLAREHGYAEANLKMQELELLEALSIRALTSNEAREFLARIPTIDYLLPLPDYAQHHLNAPREN